MIVCIILIALLLLYFILVCPNLSRKKETLSFNENLYAHRGFFDDKSEAPENTMLAFKKAIENGYGIELDVHVTKDLKCIVCHDDDLKRIAGIDKKICEITFNEIKNVNVYNTNEKIPSLEDVLNLVNGQVSLVVEIKSITNAFKETEIISRVLDKYKGKYCIESFNPLVLLWYKKHKSNVIRGQLSTNYKNDNVSGNRFRNFLLTFLLFNIVTKPDFIAYNIDYKKNISFLVCTKIYNISGFAWTVKNQSELNDSRNYYNVFIFQDFIPK
ncbi:glycerophosphodiester phosphodiesterase [Sedimentibacter sp. zth1]|uniref:glycerophosphodiester phosphodiesterase family protein n=1 Tax=Sedimentibacter sp. zth1 TaxID=2816908 RepID=UPI001A933BB1|nr:glycerophosphodiester phosphodiesterase family protein [Sedimentibacter sp. zth1]QSX05756.1 glycerophosphodiester phosphodiesterase [Sedimentibacter sp. zth1]